MSKYGVLVAWTNNVGDEIQTIAAWALLPRVDCFIDRDNPRIDSKCASAKVIFNGWFTYGWRSWVLDEKIIPLFISLHIAPHVVDLLLGKDRVKQYFKSYEPVGGRDLYTVVIMNRYGIKSYFSGCLTLTLGVSLQRLKKSSMGYILTAFNSPLLKRRVLNVLKNRYNVLDIHDSHYFLSTWRLPFVWKLWRRYGLNVAVLEEFLYKLDMPLARSMRLQRRFFKAMLQLGLVANADLVITSRLHIALPAVSFGVPVIFVHENLRDPRFWGLLDFVYPVTPAKFFNLVELVGKKEWTVRNWNRLEELRENLIARVKDFVKD